MISKAPPEAQGHVFALMARCATEETWRFTDETASPAFRAALDYLGVAVVNDSVKADELATAHSTEEWMVQEAAIELRELLRYRAYLVEWIARGKPAPRSPRAAQAPVAAVVSATAPVEARPESLVERITGGVTKAFRAVSSRFSKKQVPGRNAWTGTSGTVSYYDKDSSPD